MSRSVRGIAFALASLGTTRDYEDPIRATLAQRIIALAEAGERDPERLCESALRTISPSDERQAFSVEIADPTHAITLAS